MVGARPVDLINNNDIVLNLNPACKLADTSWINPVRSHFVIFLLLINVPQLPPIPVLESSPVSLRSVKPAATAARIGVCAFHVEEFVEKPVVGFVP